MAEKSREPATIIPKMFSNAPVVETSSKLISTATSSAVEPASLPVELWNEIFNYLIKRDLKNLRLAGKWYLAEFVTSKLFDTAYIAARRGVLDAFMGLVKHSVLRLYVKRLIYDNSWIDPLIPGNFTDNWTKAFEAVHDNQQLALAFASQESIQAYELRPSLVDSFKAFSNLKTIVFADLGRTAGLPGDILDSSLDTNLMSEQSAFGQRVLFRKFSNKVGSCCLQKGCGKKHSNFFRRQYGGLVILLDLMQNQPPATLHELCLGNTLHHITREPVGIPFFFFGRTATTFSGLTCIFPYLRKLELTISFSVMPSTRSGEHPWDHAFVCGLQKLLSAATSLEDIFLKGEACPGIFSLDLDRRWPGGALVSLRILRFKACRASFLGLSNIIWCHRHNLRELQIDDFELLDKSWPAVVRFCAKQAPDLNVLYGCTWFDGKPCAVDEGVEPEKKSNSSDAQNTNDRGENDDQDSSYSDGDDFVYTRRVVGYRTKKGVPGEVKSDEFEYEDEIETTKKIKDDSDESLEFASDDSISEMSWDQDDNTK